MAYTTLTAVRAYLGMNGPAIDDAILLSWIPAAQSQIDQRCKRTFEATSDTTRFYTADDLLETPDGMRRGSFLSDRSFTSSDYLYTQRRSAILDLGEDIASVSLLLNGDGTDATATSPAIPPTIITPNQYWLWPRNTRPQNAIQLKSTVTWILGVDQEIAVTGRFAYSLTAPADIALATHELIAYWYRSRDSQVFEVIQLPDGQLVVPRGWPASVDAILQAGNYVDPLGVI